MLNMKYVKKKKLFETIFDFLNITLNCPGRDNAGAFSPFVGITAAGVFPFFATAQQSQA